MKSGPAQLLLPKRISPSTCTVLANSHRVQREYALKFTVVPVASDKVNPSPAGTVKPLMLTVVQEAAAETSLRELIVAVQAVAADNAPGRREKAARRTNILTRA